MTTEIKELQETFQRQTSHDKTVFPVHGRKERRPLSGRNVAVSSWRAWLKDPEATDGIPQNTHKMADTWCCDIRIIRGQTPHHTGGHRAHRSPNIRWTSTRISVWNTWQTGISHVDEQVIDKVDTERFLNSLDANEEDLVRYKLEGMRDDEVRQGTSCILQAVLWHQTRITTQDSGTLSRNNRSIPLKHPAARARMPPYFHPPEIPCPPYPYPFDSVI